VLVEVGSGRSARCCEYGGAALEFAFVSIPFVLILFGSAELAQSLWNRNALQQIAAQAARCAALSYGPCASNGSYSEGATRAFVQNLGATWGLPISPDNVSVNGAGECGGLPGFSVVSLRYSDATVMPVVAVLANQTLTAAACFKNP